MGRAVRSRRAIQLRFCSPAVAAFMLALVALFWTDQKAQSANDIDANAFADILPAGLTGGCHIQWSPHRMRVFGFVNEGAP